MAVRVKDIVYRNKRYGFVLRIPGWWRNYVILSVGKGAPPIETLVHFTFRYKGKTYEDVLTIAVFALSLKEWKRQGYDESPFIFLKASRGKIFAAITPEELPEEFIDPKTGDYDYKKYGTQIRLLKRMVNDDVPKILKTFRLLSVPNAAAPKNVYLVKKVRLRRCRKRS